MNEQKVERALEYIKHGQLESGIDLLNEELLHNPNEWIICYHLGIAWRIVGDLHKSITFYQKAIKLCPDNYMNYYGIGIAFQLNGDLLNACKNLTQAHHLEKSSVEVLNSLGLTYKKMGDLSKAIEVYQHAIQTLISNIIDNLKKEGHTISHLVQNESAAMLNMELFNLVPQKLKEEQLYCFLQNNIGVCYATLGQYDEAKKAFKESIAFTPIGIEYSAPRIGLSQLELL